MKAISFYSQNFEDVLLARCFANVKDGFYIDVGAQHEEADSVTRHFYEKGWHGINIEPVSEFAKTFACRERDITVNCGAGKRDEVQTMHVSLDTGLSTFSTKNLSFADELGFATEKREINIKTLNSIIEQSGTKLDKFEFLKIDVEGFELQVLQGIDLLRYQPRIILCEVTEPNTPNKVKNFSCICEIVESYKYRKIYFDGLNQWWCKEDAYQEMREHFLLPPNVFDSTLITPYSGTQSRKQNQVDLKQISSLRQELAECNANLAECNARLAEARQELQKIKRSRSWRLIQLLGRLTSKLKLLNQ